MENIQSHTILVVDDNPTNLKVMVDFLHSHGFRALTARSGSSALERAYHGRPDLILLDVQMPEMDGMETCQRLKASPDTQSIPVIFMTAMTDLSYKVEAFAMGAVDYIVKPFQFEEVLARVNTHLQIHNLTHHLEKMVATRTAELAESLTREQRLAQELENALNKERELGQLKSQILRVVSHEFRTPLSVISQSASILENFYPRLTDEKRQRNFIRIKEAVFAVDKLLADVSLINLNESKELEVSYAAHEWETLWSDLQRHLLMKLPQATRIQFASAIGPLETVTDAMMLKHIVLQLAANALHYSEAPVVVRCYQEDGWVVIDVADRGIGIAAADQEHMFELFFRGSNIGGRRGLGVGLYLASSLATLLNGVIAVNSKQDRGSTFTLRIPVAP
ncbi:MAG: hybrid sensor histidine kinase/response regulator [Anaerolineales bacterium]|nr:hybrid sensor histidine kinase/response regulator [Anaerolineales bacterium]